MISTYFDVKSGIAFIITKGKFNLFACSHHLNYFIWEYMLSAIISAMWIAGWWYCFKFLSKFGCWIAMFGHHWIQAWHNSQLCLKVGRLSSITIFEQGQIFIQFPQLLHESLITKVLSIFLNDLSAMLWNTEPKTFANHELVSGRSFLSFRISVTISGLVSLLLIFFRCLSIRIMILIGYAICLEYWLLCLSFISIEYAVTGFGSSTLINLWISYYCTLFKQLNVTLLFQNYQFL